MLSSLPPRLFPLSGFLVIVYDFSSGDRGTRKLTDENTWTCGLSD